MWAFQYFKTLSEKGQTLLQLANVCRKFVTEKEKILPFGLPPLTRPMFEDIQQEEQCREEFENQEKVGSVYKRKEKTGLMISFEF